MVEKTSSEIASEHMTKSKLVQSFVDEESLLKNKGIKIEIHPSELSPNELPNTLNDPNINGFLNGFSILDNEGIKCDDQEVVNKQSGIFVEVVKQLTSNMLKGQGITSLSLPIKVFEPKTQLERDIEWWSFAPTFLKKAGQENDPIESLKYVTTFVLSSLFLSTEQLKPFNPYLGETYQAVFEDGSQVYLEHTSHTPCVSNYLLRDVNMDYQMSGYFDLTTEAAIKMVLNNHLIVHNKGKATIDLKASNRSLHIQFPSICISGLAYGQRVVSWRNMLRIEDHSRNLIVLVYFNKSISHLKKKRVHDFYGGIYSYDYYKEHKHKEFFEDKIRKEPDAKYKLVHFEGSYLEELFINNKKYHDFRTMSPNKFYPYYPKSTKTQSSQYTNSDSFVLPSDSRFREDLIWLKRAFLYKDSFMPYSVLSGKWKLLLEAQQRIDREKRAEKKKAEHGHKKGFISSLFGKK